MDGSKLISAIAKCAKQVEYLEGFWVDKAMMKRMPMLLSLNVRLSPSRNREECSKPSGDQISGTSRCGLFFQPFQPFQPPEFDELYLGNYWLNVDDEETDHNRTCGGTDKR